MFELNYDKLEGGDWDKLYTSYVDLSGLGQSMEYNLLVNIHNIHTRMIDVDKMLYIHRESLEHLKQPFYPAIKDLEKYGYRLHWRNDIADFLTQLKRIEVRERKNITELRYNEKQLDELTSKGAKVDNNGRHEFVRMLNQLNKEGYKIDKDDTNMEELCLMIREEKERAAEAIAKSEHNGK